MDKHKVIHTDFLAQMVFVGLILTLLALSLAQGQLLTWGIVVLLLLIIWQFFSGVYIAAEFKMWHRLIPPLALMVLVTIAILFAALEFTLGVFISLCLFPLVLLSNVTLALLDWYQQRHQFYKRWKGWHPIQETILDTEDMFK